MNNDFDTAVQRILAAIDAVTKLDASLADIPLDITSDLTTSQRLNRLKSLDAIDGRLSVDDSLPNPQKAAAQTCSQRFFGASAKATLEDRLGSILFGVDQQRNALLRSLDAEQSVAAGHLRSGDFGTDGLVNLDMALVAGGQGTMVAGLYERLPDGHPMRRLISSSECYHLSNGRLGNPRVLFLGLPMAVLVGQAPPRYSYRVASALALTKHHRAVQVRQQEERAEQQRREQRQQDNDFWNSPLGILKRQQEALRRLEEAGQIPEFTKPAPAVRH